MGLSAAGIIRDKFRRLSGAVSGGGGPEVGCASWLNGRHTDVVLSIQAVNRAERQQFLLRRSPQVIAVSRSTVLL